MEIEKSGFDHELRSMEHSVSRLLSSPESSETTAAGLEFSAEPLPQTPELSNPPPPPSSKAVVDQTQTPVVEDGSKQKTSDWNAELERLKSKYYVEELDLWILPYDDDSVDNIEFPEVQPYCDICGRDHYPSGCAYLTEIPHDVKPVNESKYVIVCGCGRTIVDGCCPGSCVSWRPRHVVYRVALEDPYINIAAIERARERSIERARERSLKRAQRRAAKVERNLK